MKRLLTASLIAASIASAYAQTSPEIAKSATLTAKEAKIQCQKLAIAPKNCVIAHFDEDFELSKKPSHLYRVLNGKTADDQFIATDYHRNGQQQADSFATSNRQALLTSAYTEELGITAKAYTMYDEDGQKIDATDLTDGIANGVRTQWYATGSKKEEAVYKDDSQNGSYQSWYENGSKQVAGDIQDGLQIGEWHYWHENGKMESKGSYDNGLKTGEWHYWYENGAAEDDAHYKAGQLDGARTYWYDNGKKHSQGSMANDLQVGQWTFWHENGEKESQGEFDAQENRTGTWTEWDEAGKKISTSVYANGALVSVDGKPVPVAAPAVDAAKEAAVYESTKTLDAEAAAEDLDTSCTTFKRADQCVIAFFDKNSEPQATAKNAAYYRVLYAKVDDLYIVQDFFANGKKQSNVDFARSYNGVLYSFDISELNAQGTIKGYDAQGREKFSTTFDQGEPVMEGMEGLDDMQDSFTQTDEFEEVTDNAVLDAAKSAARATIEATKAAARE